ncbi:MAG: hypothetical protein DWQ36_14825 [Acidobacteria bacterium]|nr:MAG: hypothetical protein DWQ30_03560 [Acidobacteriota bacterium]REK06165.1 MAG: hypothetical protein DWQ36_14825 [Acidobacteriota bacterium]
MSDSKKRQSPDLAHASGAVDPTRRPGNGGAEPPTADEQALAALLRGLPERLLPSRYFEAGAIAATDVATAARAVSRVLLGSAAASGEAQLGPETFQREIAARLGTDEARAEQIFDWLQEVAEERPFVFPKLVAERSDGETLQLLPDQGLPGDLAFRWALTREVLEEVAEDGGGETD